MTCFFFSLGSCDTVRGATKKEKIIDHTNGIGSYIINIKLNNRNGPITCDHSFFADGRTGPPLAGTCTWKS